MAQQQIIEQMTEVEARGALLAIRGNLATAATLIADFEQRLGWKALGYADLESCLLVEFGHPTLRAFIEHELGYSQSQSYRLAAVNEVADNIARHSPMGEKPVLRERWVRDSGLEKLEPQHQAEAHVIAQQLREAEGAKHSTARHYQEAVQVIQQRQTVFSSPYHVVTQMVITGAITAQTGQEMNAALEKLSPRRRGLIVQLLATFRGPMPDLFAPVAEKLDRPVGKESLVAPEILHGYIAGVPLAKATPRDLAKANFEAQRQHQAEAAERKRQAQLEAGRIPVEEIALTIYKGDMPKTVEALRRALGDQQFMCLLDAMLAE